MSRQIEITDPARPKKTVTLFDDGSLVVADAAAVLGKTPQAIRAWINQGAPLHFEGGPGRGNGMRVKVGDLLEWREGKVSESFTKLNADGFNEREEKARERHHAANIKEREDRRQAGELVHIEAVAGIVELQFSEIRAGLQNLPSRMATELSVISDPREIREILRSEVHSVLVSLAGGEEVASMSVGIDPKKSRAVDGDGEEDLDE